MHAFKNSMWRGIWKLWQIFFLHLNGAAVGWGSASALTDRCQRRLRSGFLTDSTACRCRRGCGSSSRAHTSRSAATFSPRSRTIITGSTWLHTTQYRMRGTHDVAGRLQSDKVMSLRIREQETVAAYCKDGYRLRAFALTSRPRSRCWVSSKGGNKLSSRVLNFYLIDALTQWQSHIAFIASRWRVVVGPVRCVCISWLHLHVCEWINQWSN
jgi:hypothetical protein